MPIPPPPQHPQPPVDAVVCYHNHFEAIVPCVVSLDGQVRQILIVDDGSEWGQRLDLVAEPSVVADIATVLPRATRHGVANSFNYGAFHSNADWLLYVDPHCVFQPHAVATLLHAAGTDYAFALGLGTDTLLDPADPWATALDAIQAADIPLTFLIRRTLWEAMQGIPEPPYCHMDVLADALTQRGELIACVTGVCTHARHLTCIDGVKAFWQAGFAYGRVADQFPTVLADEAARLTVDQVTLYTKLLFTSAHRLGVLTGLGKVPTRPLDVGEMRFEWLRRATTQQEATE